MGIYEVDGETDDIVSMADRAYIARQTIKNKGDTAWAFYDGAVRDKLLHEKEIESQMEKALAEGEFIAYYQPKYSTKEQKLIGAEALVRWRRSDGIIVPPYQFVPLFERNGFINKVDRYMFELVCRQQMRWLKQGLIPVPISVNMSRMCLYDPHIVDEYIGVLNTDRKLYKDALDNYQSSAYCFQKAVDTLGVIYVYRDIARIYYVEQKYDSVYNYINRALSLCEKKKGCISFERVIPSLLQVKGIAKRNEGDLGDAIALLKTAVETEQDRHSMHHCSMSLGNIYLNLNKLDEAGRCFALALNSENPRTLAGAYHYLYLLEKKQKKYAMALYFKEKSDSLLVIERDAKQTSQILTLQRKYERGKLLLEKQQVEREKQIQLYFWIAVVLFIILLCIVLYFLLRKRYEGLFRKNMQIIEENECMIKRYVYELDVLKQRAGEMAETNREKIAKLNQKILLLESENKKISENVCVNGVYLLEQLKKEKLIVKNMTNQEKEQLLEYIDLIYGNFISRLKKDFKLTSGNLMLLALLKVGFTSSELMFTFDCEMNSIFTKKRRLRGILSLDTNDKLEEFVALY